LSNRFDNRFDNRLYRVNGAFIYSAGWSINLCKACAGVTAPATHGSWVTWVMGQELNGSLRSWVTLSDPFPALVQRIRGFTMMRCINLRFTYLLTYSHCSFFRLLLPLFKMYMEKTVDRKFITINDFHSQWEAWWCTWRKAGFWGRWNWDRRRRGASLCNGQR